MNATNLMFAVNDAHALAVTRLPHLFNNKN